tara:strand:+ start:1658 stop:2359 length:702 start_codon:yes stop_codon:yes gene_type:complete
MYEVLHDCPTDLFKSNKYFSFLNPNTLKLLDESKIDTSKILFFCDGISLSKILSFKLKKKIKRYSFDFTSIADSFFREISDNESSIYIKGATTKELDLFKKKIKEKHKKLSIVGTESGFEDNWEDSFKRIKQSSCTHLLVGMGAPKQERFLNFLLNKNLQCTVLTCGAFLSQTAISKNTKYYPKFFDNLNIRFLYRMFKEPHTVRRYMFNYPAVVFQLLFTDKYKISLSNNGK